ncbi:hypothetical protein P153DRAFT_369949 [Dothidotthia symphoricarpi CBS 119687]|uniref:Uncharacterized protein n=1 Tax=Dothidotthia symphoricarpi CBS 119687 TaxID=1392245 RepID=A0A6A6A252_9PLEO|nr:uncharacterized protein P153DRAFT_369949 [Dothidotthia symphoricarpi CBS 119687]KAF2125253.1 hypothetical protein P153DRAFT_369949 [Dothidotthia symphoricarpi CBS 119687]
MSQQVQPNSKDTSNTPMPDAEQPTPKDPSNTPIPFEQLPPPRITRECNFMCYKDNEGVEHRIHIPQGQFKQACQHFIDEDWAALGRFPPSIDSSAQSPPAS